MPAGTPPGGINRRFIVGQKVMRQDGADVSVGYERSARNPVNGNILVTGDTSYVGLIDDGLFGQPTQGAVLPAGAGAFQDASFNSVDGGWLVMQGNDVFLLAADLSASTDITPPAIISRAGIVAFNGLLIIAADDFNFPDRDLELSADNGTTWDSDPGGFTGIGADLDGIVTNPAENLVLAFSAGGALFATAGPDLIWTTHPSGSAGNPVRDAAISDDGTKFCVVSQTGSVATHEGVIADGLNPFPPNQLNAVEWIEELQGFVIIQENIPQCAFVDGNDATVVIPGTYVGEGMSIENGGGVTDGKNAIWPGNNNLCMCTLRAEGDSGINT